MIGNMGGPTLIVIVFIVLLLFGAPKLPALAKSLGQSMKILKKEVRSDDESTTKTDDAPKGDDSDAPKKSE
ncbi:twin-arginine translocase TatA/TatE family subunit [Leucobacter sp. NPDC015123]|uniref:twin-arginine translocase TatA/TatE family subunit n=1 Tax=Leucobacter sp. NPDC015123 TaxID=3364129 RepID=UPI0036F4591D